MDYYIQGNEERAEEIKATFEKLGVASNTDRYNYKNDNVLYFTAGGMIHMIDANGSWANIIKTNPGYKELELPVEFKNGDIIGFNDCTHNDGSYKDWVGIYRHQSNDFINHQHFFHCVATSMNTFRIGGSWRVFTAYPATKEQRDLLFRKMREAGYTWDDDKKELRKIQPHYDIANFKPFDKVLVRDNDRGKWRASIFSYHIKGRQTCYPFCCIGNSFSQCIPYEGNEHLLGTTDMCDEQYINW